MDWLTQPCCTATREAEYIDTCSLVTYANEYTTVPQHSVFGAEDIARGGEEIVGPKPSSVALKPSTDRIEFVAVKCKARNALPFDDFGAVLQPHLSSEIYSPRLPPSIGMVNKGPKHGRRVMPSDQGCGVHAHLTPRDSRAALKDFGQTPRLGERCFSHPPAGDNCPSQDSASASSQVGPRFNRERLDQLLSFGDILSIRGSDRLARIGENGGFMGHVLLATDRPTCIQRHTPEASSYLRLWPDMAITCIWRVPVIESTRGIAGLSESELLMYVDPKSGRILVVGEVSMTDDVEEIAQFDHEEPESVEIWRSPPELRRVADENLMRKALFDLKARCSSWSWATAVRAFLLQGQVTMPSDPASSEKTLNSIQDGWISEPICTSVVITFWQRYLCHLASMETIPGVGDDALAMILEYMPLKADRAMPGELMGALRAHKWQNIARVPLANGPSSPPCMVRVNSH